MQGAHGILYEDDGEAMTHLYRCTRCGRIVELDLEDGCVPRCEEKFTEYYDFGNSDYHVWICGGQLEKASKDDDSFHSR